MFPIMKPQNSGDNGPPTAIIPPPPQSSSTRRNSGGSSITKNVNGVTSIKISTPPTSSVPSPPIVSLSSSTGSIGGHVKTSTPNKYNNDQLNAFDDECADDELELSIPESDSVPSHLPPRRIHSHRSNRIGLSASASSSPEAGVSPQTLAEQGWKSFDGVDEDKWIEEGRLLIEPGDDEEDDDCEETRKRQESDDEDDEEDVVDVWSMSKDQQEYYGKQFQSLLGSSGGSKVSGPVAKEFFIRSKLTSSELANIWQLSDIDKDGSLNLAEFSIAMHLVVLRKKASIEVPSSLPKSLVSSALKISPAMIIHGHGDGAYSNGVKKQLNKSSSIDANLIDMSSSPGDLQVSGHFVVENPQVTSFKDQGKEWTKFTDSPTARKNKVPLITDQGQKVNSFIAPSETSSADDSSQGLVNFDFPSSSIDSNPRIVHPVALRLTPEGQCLVANPEPIILKSGPGKSTQPLIPPPLPPPRPSARSVSGHARSSSLDLNKLHGNNRRSTWSSNGGNQYYYGIASQPPNITSMSPSNLKGQLEAGIGKPLKLDLVAVDEKDDHHGAFSVYKKTKSPLPPPLATSSVTSDPEKGHHSRTLKVIQSQFGLEPFPSLIPKYVSLF